MKITEKNLRKVTRNILKELFTRKQYGLASFLGQEVGEEAADETMDLGETDKTEIDDIEENEKELE